MTEPSSRDGDPGTDADGYVDFRLFGPLEVRVCGHRRLTPGSRSRTVLASLLIAEGEVLSVGRLVDAVWGPTPPATAEKQIKNSISDLRKQLSGAAVDVETVPPGYRLRIRQGDTDLHGFRRRLALARKHAAGGQTEDAIAEYRNALALCDGPLLSDVHSEFLDGVVAKVDEETLTAHEECVELELDHGKHRVLVVELLDLVAANPHREGLVCCLMRALAESGQRARALAVYERASRVLGEQYHTAPGPRLRELHARITTSEPAPAATPAPDTLPPDVDHLVGRSAALGEVVATAGTGRSGASARGTTVVIGGMPGVGKTALTIRAARELAGDFPDARLFLDLGGHAGDEAPLNPTAALGHLLGALGVPAGALPADPAERAALWRSTLRTRRALVVLDDALSSAQIRPLLPDTTNCLVLVNSRHRLAGLDEVRTVSLDVLTLEQGRTLFTHALGDGRAGREPAAVDTVVRHCEGLPLAVLIAAARLRHRRSWRVSDLADKLADGDRLLDELHAEDRSVSAAIRSSYTRLSADLQRFFRSLAHAPAGPIQLADAAALTGLPHDRAEQALDVLADRHIVEPTVPGTYRIHGLVRAYARARACGKLARVRSVGASGPHPEKQDGAA